MAKIDEEISVADVPEKRFDPNKTLGDIDKQISAVAADYSEWQEFYDEIIVDPSLIAVTAENGHLERLFAITKLNAQNIDHWKLLLAMVIETTYHRNKIGRPKKSYFEGDAKFLRHLVATVQANREINTAVKLAGRLIGTDGLRMNTQKSVENKISKVRGRARREAADAELQPRLPIAIDELKELLAILDERLPAS